MGCDTVSLDQTVAMFQRKVVPSSSKVVQPKMNPKCKETLNQWQTSHYSGLEDSPTPLFKPQILHNTQVSYYSTSFYNAAVANMRVINKQIVCCHSQLQNCNLLSVTVSVKFQLLYSVTLTRNSNISQAIKWRVQLVRNEFLQSHTTTF